LIFLELTDSLLCWKWTVDDPETKHWDFGTALLAMLHDLGQGTFDEKEALRTSGLSGKTTKKQVANQEVMQPRLW
jgi:hypothetical protein